MSDIFDQLVSFFETLVATIGYPGIFIVMFAENLFPPVPTDPLLPFAGMLVAEGEMRFLIVWGMAIGGALSGSLLLYVLGAWADGHVIRRIIRRWGAFVGIDIPALERAMGMINRYGAPYILIGRSIPVIRSAVSLTAGMSHMPIGRFIVFSGLNSAIVTGFWILMGVLLGENWEEIWAFLRPLEPIIYGLLLAGLIVLIFMGLRRFRQRPAANSQPPSASGQ